jgi:DNA repair protein RadC
MPITHWPLNEQPREKILSCGAKQLSDTELIAIFLRTGVRGKSAIDLARELLCEYGSLKKLFNADPEQLFQKRGLGKAKYAMLKAAIELGRRYFEEDITLGEPLNNSLLTKRFIVNRLSDYQNEVFACLFLDIQNRMISFDELFYGTINEANVYPREVVKRALRHNAAKVIFAHNHPSGTASPSQADIAVTQLLKKALALVEIQVIDHIIVGSHASFSFAEAGLV